MATRELHVALLRCLREDVLPLLVTECLSPFRLAAPMSYMLTVAMALIRGSILAALMTKLPLPQIPIAPIASLST
ncbi:hypothetical protein MPY17_19935 [Rhodococcus opacus]|uniref:hypothetical protein n=1 Tax=Rhodococcus opacus TaxID=37919 RepID=UPI001FF108E4|nr:hypothetical protein [Rhodococcus opacus]UOT01304.1 hypothetical protein MPY17_19935 [Rhodococcus opacus]